MPPEAGWESEHYARGLEHGALVAKMQQHEERLNAINGSVADVGHKLGEIRLSLQRLEDSAHGRDSTVLATAAALKDAEAVRSQKELERRQLESDRISQAERAWNPVSRLALLLGVVLSLFGVLSGLATLWPHLPHR